MIGTNYRVPQVDVDKCRTCRICQARKSCRLKALVQFESHELPYIDQSLCRGCGICLDECPFKAIVIK